MPSNLRGTKIHGRVPISSGRTAAAKGAGPIFPEGEGG